jgi:hypothetical protein
MLRDQRPRQAGEFALLAEPQAQRLGRLVHAHRCVRVEPEQVDDGVDERRGIARPQAERVAGFVVQARSFERQLDMADVPVTAAAGQALVCEDFGAEGLFARPGRCGGRPQRRDRRERCGAPDLFAGQLQRALGPGLGDSIDVHVRIGAIEQARGAEFGQARVERAADLAELRIAAVAEAEHAELEVLEFRRALAEHEVHKAARVVRRFAVALRADDDDEQAFGLQFADRVGIGAHQAHLQAARFRLLRELFGQALGVAGLAAVDHAEARCADRVLGQRRGHRARHAVAGLARQARRIAGQPPERGTVESVDEPRQFAGLGLGQRDQGQRGIGGHGCHRVQMDVQTPSDRRC